MKHFQSTFLLFVFIHACNQTILCKADEFKPLMMLPAETNVVTVIRLKEMLSSKISQQEGWEKKLEERFQNGITAIPPGVDTYIIGSKVQPFAPRRIWTIGLTKLPAQHSFSDLAQHEGATLEQLAERNAFYTRRGEYMVSLPEAYVAKITPAERQEVSRYVRNSLTQQQVTLSSYLQSAYESDAHVVMAMDMQDMINPSIAQRYLLEDDRFSSHRKVVDKLVKLLAGIRGIKVQMTNTSTIDTEVHLEFSEDVGTSAFSLRAILLGLLEDMGAYIDELEKAEVKTMGNKVVLATKLSEESFRFLLSFVVPSRLSDGQIEFQPRNKPVTPQELKPSLTPQQVSANYILSINKMLDDLERANNRAKSTSRVYAWHDNYATKIRGLDKSMVSTEALEYGDKVAYALNQLASSLRGDAFEVNTLEGTITYQYQYSPGYVNYNPWGWNWNIGMQQGYYNVTSNLQQVREKQATAVNSGSQEREEIWNNIRAERNRMERFTSVPK